MFKFNKLSNLKELFERYITISVITEDFIAFDAQEDAKKCFACMEEKQFTNIGVKESGRIIGYARLSIEDKGLLGEHKIGFEDDEILFNNAPLSEALHHLVTKQFVFVKENDEILGIITRADLYKPAIRIWLYGLVSILEIHMLELIRLLYSEESWMHKLSICRKKNVRKTYKKRKKRNEEIDLLYCTEFCDKRTIIEKSEVALKAIGFESKAKFSKCFKEIEELRNEVAHSCKVCKNQWETISYLCKKMEFAIDNIENFFQKKRMI